MILHWIQLYASGQLRFSLGLQPANPFSVPEPVHLCDWHASFFVEFADGGFPHPSLNCEKWNGKASE
jgi:hypothetical protein